MADFLNVLLAYNNLLQSQSNLSDSGMQIETSLVTLYRAQGGSWEFADKQ